MLKVILLHLAAMVQERGANSSAMTVNLNLLDLSYLLIQMLDV